MLPLLYSFVRETCFGEESYEMVTLDSMKKGAALQKATDESYEETQQGSFLPRLQLMTANSDKCKAGEFPINHYALVSDQKYTDLGPNLDVLVCSWRHMALMWGEDTMAVYDHKSDLYLEIQDKANSKVDGHMWGYQALLWIPAANTFATWFAGSPTARRAFTSMKSLLHERCTMGSQKITGKGKNPNVWFGPTHDECSTEFPMPRSDKYMREMEKFNNPKEETLEIAEDDGREQ